MARKKEYREEEVIDKAMRLFWRNGYERTSMQMLEKVMGINKFSIYSSFGSKRGVFLQSLNCYQSTVGAMFEKFKKASNGVEDIKQFFYDSVAICAEEGNVKGCLLTNTYNEFSESDDPEIKTQVMAFMDNLKLLFLEKLRIGSNKEESLLLKQANFLVIAKHGLAAASRVNSREEIEDYIEMTFTKI
ncbi:TetR/AcrR family transcriptional regulator [Cyclobacterium marinum]|uniref:Regulatory protein TetR n=1 Tax=Cyclobacterium marinum (strain ATCC 25205 / DSM 745 / LMG 13164 / NCIMB 1802) TaxID=880070 RepID=G0J4R9_CYCMS|nr:TetR/AcrR family transcriptional regulator [Cyclobacterium marinum]AEL25299.1 regulatory protein TetR [Cyclobacterium marinum DSM 745]MBI0400625.1 TetR/AcrR family transcriptional regulator [Cyclobacterium marinum]MBR9774563.1 TetR/AcrR family transcriptional regulator [Cytophagales bacterium]|tara:strand:- start:50524 stop:51087 length:564 start_codon:yes stop_codon:yes gene_type:complete